MQTFLERNIDMILFQARLPQDPPMGQSNLMVPQASESETVGQLQAGRLENMPISPDAISHTTATLRTQYSRTPEAAVNLVGMTQPNLAMESTMAVNTAAPLHYPAPAYSDTQPEFTMFDEIAPLYETSLKEENQLSPSLEEQLDARTLIGNGDGPSVSISMSCEGPSGSHKNDLSNDRNIKMIISRQDPNILEAAVDKAVMVLERLKKRVSPPAADSPDAQSWVHTIDQLILKAKRERTITGVVGNTGAGKSSVINAMLDKERLVPTNCMRACTTVVTEISWNNCTDVNSKYRAEIVFISQGEWEKELTILVKEFLTETGNITREASDPNSDAGIAWAKFHAVYPEIPRDSLSGLSVSDLVTQSAISKVLGTSKTVSTDDANRFYRELQIFVDSNEKVTKKDMAKGKGKKIRQMEYWPLIKVVRIYTKSSALSTGAVIVDLPGVQDSNAARAAVAQGYMKQCTGLWIVAPINRAVDDKSAKTLLGDSFKRQLKYDGGFPSVTFICSKIDDISITEAIGSLQLDEEATEFEEQIETYQGQIESIENKIAWLRKSQQIPILAISTANEEIVIWEDLQDDLNDEGQVFAPLPKCAKRKKPGLGQRARKRGRGNSHESDDDFAISDDEITESNDEVEILAERALLTAHDVRCKLKELREKKKQAKSESMEIKRSIDELKPQRGRLQARIEEFKARISHICIAGRNNYSKTAIQQDFAAGIREMDQENAAEVDETNFDPNEELRDYVEVARSLPVFCVSSRAYQKMRGRLVKDDDVPGFIAPEETEVPQLQEHCRKLTEIPRVQAARTFLLGLCQLLTAFQLWCSDEDCGLNLSDAEKQSQLSFLNHKLDKLTLTLNGVIHSCISEMRLVIKDQIFDKFPGFVDDAINKATTTTEAWGHKEMGGLAWSTYKAVVRREGVFQSELQVTETSTSNLSILF